MPAHQPELRRRLFLVVSATMLVAGPLLAPAAAVAAWLRPVPGDLVRPFDFDPSTPFERGAHRGADLAAAPGAPVRSACTGRVVHVGVVARLGRVLTAVCGSRRVTYLPLASVVAREHEPIARGGPIGALAGGHGGLHVGVRRAGGPFAYEDPLAHMGDARGVPPIHVVPGTPARPRALRPLRLRPLRLRPLRLRPLRLRPPPAARAERPRLSHPPVAPPQAPPSLPAAPLEDGPRANAPLAVRPVPRGPRPRHHPLPGELAPWPVWAGLTLVLAGAAGSSTLAVRHRRARTRRAGAFVPRLDAGG